MIRLAVAVSAAAVLAGCAATVVHGSDTVVRVPEASATTLVLNVTGSGNALASSDWPAFKAAWAQSFAAQAAAAHIAFRMQDGPAGPTGEQGTLLAVFVDDYRMIRPGVREGVGILGGNAFIESTFRFNSLKTGETFAVHTVNVSSPSWQSALAAMTDAQVEAIAADVMQTLRSSAPAPASADASAPSP